MTEAAVIYNDELVDEDLFRSLVTGPHVEPLIGRTREDPFYTYPVPFHPLLPKLIDYWLWNHTPSVPLLDFGKQNWMRTSYFNHCLSQPALFYELLLFSFSSHLKRNGSTDPQDQPILAVLKANAIETTNSLLRNSDGLISDKTLLAVNAMASYELVFGDRATHQSYMQGIQMICNGLGGINSPLISRDIAIIVTICDVNQSRVTGHPPYLFHLPRNTPTATNLSPATIPTYPSNKATLFGFGHISSQQPDFGLIMRNLNLLIIIISHFNFHPSNPSESLVVGQTAKDIILKLVALRPTTFFPSQHPTAPADAHTLASVRLMEVARLGMLGTCYRLLRHFNQTTPYQTDEEASVILCFHALEGLQLPPQHIGILIWALFMCGQNAERYDDLVLNRMIARAAGFLGCTRWEHVEGILGGMGYLRGVNWERCVRVWDAVILMKGDGGVKALE